MANLCPKCHTENPAKSKFCKDCGTSLPGAADISLTQTMETPQEELTTGSTFAGRYQIIEELGRGGMGRVYKALDIETKEKISLKLIKAEISSDKTTIERFRNELITARRISHRNVCRMFDLSRDKDRYFITMEYVSGGDLKKFIRRSKRLDVGTAISIAKQVCVGLGEAHRLGIVHRDLKPNNIMIDDRGGAKIMDFGIARSAKTKGMTGPGVMIGTPEYMSPEQVDGKDIDHRTDIYAMGVILYEMLTGQLPFEGDTPFSVSVKQKSEIPEDPRKFNPGISEDLGSIILKCLEKEREGRYQNSEELCAELDRIEKGLPATDRVVPKRKPLTSGDITVQFSMKKAVLPVLGLVVIVIAGLLLWHPWSRDKAGPIPPSDKPSLAVMYFENNTGDENLDHWRKGISDLLITDLAQSRYMKVLGGDRMYDILDQMNQLDAKGYASQVLREVAEQGGVNHIARGSYSKAGDILRIDMVIQDSRSGEPIASQRVEGKGEEAIFTMVDELTRWTKKSLRLSSEQIAGDVDREIANVTTSSPEALKFYAEGVQHFNQQEERQSIAFFEKAIVLDPEFAMAFRKMAIAYGNEGYRAEEAKYMQKALELRDRLPDRERLLIEGSHFGGSRSTYDKAIEAYEKLIDLYPESDETISAHHNLGLLYNRIEEWDKAIAHSEAAIKAGSKTRSVYTNLASQYMGKGDYHKAEVILKDSISRYTDFASAHWILGQIYTFQGRFDLALDEADKAAAIDPTFTKAQFYHMMWDFEKAEEEYKKWFGHISPSTHLMARERLSLLYRTLGRFEEAKHQILLGIDEAKKQKHDLYHDQFHYELAYLSLFMGNVNDALEAARKTMDVSDAGTLNKIFKLELEGWIYSQMGRMDEAAEKAEEIKRLADTKPLRSYVKEYHATMGLIELNRKNYPDAIESFKKTLSLLPHPNGFLSDNSFYWFYLAQAFEGSGELKAARDELEKIIAFIPGRIQCGDYHAKSCYLLGQIYEKLGNPAEAKENYEKFLELWKDADPGLPEVVDAKKRLDGLKGQ